MHLLEARAHLMLMGLLHRHRDVSARSARKALGLTDGNLASHAKRLEQAGWLQARHALSPTGFEVRYRITAEGSAAFRQHVEGLRRLLDGWVDAAEPEGSRPALDQGPKPRARRD